jgi:hypothetical protein
MFAPGLVMRMLLNYVESGRTDPVLPQCELQLGGSEINIHFTKNREGCLPS